MRVGVLMLPTDPWEETVGRARHIEQLGYDHLWTYDHLSWRRYRERPWFGAIPWLTGIAANTTRLRLGPMVTSPNFRHPLTLAKDTIALDHVSGGRLVLGVGAGGLGFDSTVFGHDPLSPGKLVARLDEFVAVLDRLLREPAASHTGEFYTVNDARLIPGCVQSPRVPLAIAAAGPKALEIVARYGDAWITYGMPDGSATQQEIEGAVRRQVATLERSCAAIGRDPAGIERVYLIGNNSERPTSSSEAFGDFAMRYASLGFTDLVFHHPRADDPMWDDPIEIVDAIAHDVVPPLRSV
jgi:alkanesulfonate monooxygenase SsuD/methylene tetrahydromethanopterin reductase-like flavin-dependent oxidoreductase (luciferase family)